MKFRKINKYNYWECIELEVNENQLEFIVDNKQSLIESLYEDNLYVLGIYQEETMVGFLMYDYDDIALEWSLCRFMIGKQYQGKGYGKKALSEFCIYLKRKYRVNKIYTEISLGNEIACKLFSELGFRDVNKSEYTVLKKRYMVKEL